MFAEWRKFTLISPQGRGIKAPLLAAEANAYALDKWVVIAPRGLIWLRGEGQSPVEVKGSALRASLSKLSQPIPNLAIELINPTFISGDTTNPFFLSNAERFEAYVRPTKDVDDSLDVLWRIEGGKGSPLSRTANVTRDQSFNWHIEARLNKAKHLNSLQWQQGLANWRSAGGVASQLRASLKLEDMQIYITSPSLSLDAEARLLGQAHIELSGPVSEDMGDVYDVLGRAGLLETGTQTLVRRFARLAQPDAKKSVKIDVNFRDGGTYLGPLRLADAPQVK
jgi:hypothetical protein